MLKIFEWSKRSIYFCIFYSGAAHLLRFASSVRGPRLRILYGHNLLGSNDEYKSVFELLEFMDAPSFERRIRFLKKHCTPVSMDQATDALKKGALPSHAVALTFDDGYKDNLEIVLPILKKYGVPAAFYLTSGFMDGAHEFWFNKLIESVCRTSASSLQLGPGKGAYSLRTSREKVEAINGVVALVKAVPENEKQKILQDVEERLGYERGAGKPILPMLSWTEVRELLASPLATLGGHTMTHPVLTRIPEAEARREIVSGKELLCQKTGQDVRHFAYPNGRAQDQNARIRELVAEAGFTSACTTEPGGNPLGSDPYMLKRDGFDQEPFYMFGLKVLGFFDLIGELKCALKSVRSLPRQVKSALLSVFPRNLLIRQASGVEGKVFLTFDDGPHPENTEKILDILKASNAKATFFMVGPEIEKYPAIARRVVQEGHEVASHGWHHERMSQLDFPGIRDEIGRTDQIIEKTCGAPAQNFRPPYGRLTVALLWQAFLKKKTIVLWSLDSDDDRTRSPQVILDGCGRAVQGDVILFHDDNLAIIEALPEAIREMRQKGLAFGLIRDIGQAPRRAPN